MKSFYETVFNHRDVRSEFSDRPVPDEALAIFELPELVVPIAYLCLAYVDFFTSARSLKRSHRIKERSCNIWFIPEYGVSRIKMNRCMQL